MKFNFNLRFVRYFLIIFSVIISTYTIQIFVQNFNIEKEVNDLKSTQVNLSGDTFWIKNYYEPFLKTKYANMILKHKSGIIQENEILIKITSFQENIDEISREIKYVKEGNDIRCIDFFKTLYNKYF